MTGLTLHDADLIADRALTEGREHGLAPLCVVVLDAGGHPLIVKRDERASIHRADIATAKAGSCLAMGFGGRELARRAALAPHFFDSLATVLPTGMIAVPGGVLIRSADGALVGAVGISGDTSDNDEICGVAGIEAVGLVADTGAPPA